MTIHESERQRILDKVDKNWDDLTASLESFDEDELTIPNVIGIWSLKDLIGHLETWDRIAIRSLADAENGRVKPDGQSESQPSGSINEFNEADADQKRHKSIALLWQELNTTHAELVDRLKTSNGLSDDLIRHDTYAHYADHLNDIRKWQTARGTNQEASP